MPTTRKRSTRPATKRAAKRTTSTSKTSTSKTSRSRTTAKRTTRSRQPARDRSSVERVSEVMTPEPVTMIESDTIFDAARLMREEDIGDVIVLDDTSARVKAIVTDRDMVIRAVAEGFDPRETTLAAIATGELVTVAPTDALDKAARLMRDKAIRRLPVCDEDGRAVGVVSLGDLALEMDRRSALAEISAAPSNN